MREVMVVGVGMTSFGKHRDRGLAGLATEALEEALTDAGLRDGEQSVGMAYFSNVLAGVLVGQESNRGQHALRDSALRGVP